MRHVRTSHIKWRTPVARHPKEHTQVYPDKAGKFRFRLKAGNGEIAASDEAYETRAAAERAARSYSEQLTGANINHLQQ